MEIKLNYTQEELSTLLDGLNNACIALGDVYTAGRSESEAFRKAREHFYYFHEIAVYEDSD